jgi:glycosyltransferase involved in cell wall biosynthesis
VRRSGPCIPEVDFASVLGASNKRRWAVVAASGRTAAHAYSRDRGIEPTAVLGKSDILVSPHRLRELIRETAVDGVIVHSVNWRRERSPQLYRLALSLMPVRERYIVDEEARVVHRIGSGGLAPGFAHVSADALWDALVIAREAARLSYRRNGSDVVDPSQAGVPCVLAVWPGSSMGFGGSLAHITGILGGFKRSGLRVGVLTRAPLPKRLQRIVDDFEVTPPLSEASRLTWETEQISANRALRRAGRELARRLKPTFVYQRHSPFLVGGADLAAGLGIPLILEWNGSQVWVRKNWKGEGSSLLARVLDPLLLSMERNVLSRASLVSAVSREASEMAFRVGAKPERTIVVPNAVDVGEVDAALTTAESKRDNGGPLLGWAGSFGPWHGAEVAVRAMAKLPETISLRMIGTGNEWVACKRLAESLGVGTRVEMTGALGHDETMQKLAECDVLLSPHTPLRSQPFFGSPIKIFEYMAIGKPIVVSRLGQLGELFEEGVTARMVTPGDVDELADAVMEVLGSPDRGRALGEAARRVAEREHSWDGRARAILERLDVPVGSPRAPESPQEV